MLRKHYFLSVLFAFTLLCSGCELLDDIFKQEKETTEKEKEEEKKNPPGTNSKEKPFVFDYNRYTQEWAAWEKVKMKNYKFSAKMANFRRIHFTVLDGTVTSSVPERVERFTIDEAFRRIQKFTFDIPESLKRSGDVVLSAELNIDYDAQYHYPLLVSPVYKYDEALFKQLYDGKDGYYPSDDGSFEILDFTPLP